MSISDHPRTALFLPWKLDETFAGRIGADELAQVVLKIGNIVGEPPDNGFAFLERTSAASPITSSTGLAGLVTRMALAAQVSSRTSSPGGGYLVLLRQAPDLGLPDRSRGHELYAKFSDRDVELHFEAAALRRMNNYGGSSARLRLGSSQTTEPVTLLRRDPPNVCAPSRIASAM